MLRRRPLPIGHLPRAGRTLAQRSAGTAPRACPDRPLPARGTSSPPGESRMFERNWTSTDGVSGGSVPLRHLSTALVLNPGDMVQLLERAADAARVGMIRAAERLDGIVLEPVLHIIDQLPLHILNSADAGGIAPDRLGRRSLISGPCKSCRARPPARIGRSASSIAASSSPKQRTSGTGKIRLRAAPRRESSGGADELS